MCACVCFYILSARKCSFVFCCLSTLHTHLVPFYPPPPHLPSPLPPPLLFLPFSSSPSLSLTSFLLLLLRHLFLQASFLYMQASFLLMEQRQTLSTASSSFPPEAGSTVLAVMPSQATSPFPPPPPTAGVQGSSEGGVARKIEIAEMMK